jgi:2-amino-4-hydroxy-6-hydroxymethyldihydropteridine diphosphokinase
MLPDLLAEMLIGRKKSFRNGPRLIDLDIIMYGTNKVSTDDLQVSWHEQIQETLLTNP